jgi:tetratricopeptide (TPR) repeat protein
MNAPTMPPALAAALAAHQKGALADAEAGYRAVIREQPDNPDALHLLSILCLQQGRAEEALPVIERVIELVPDAADAHGNMGSALQALERFSEAVQAFRTAISFAPDAAHHHYNLGNTLRADGDKQGAVQAYREAIRCAPDLVQAHSNLATTLSELGLFDEAVAHCKLAIQYQPGFADAHYNLGNAYREAGRHEDAIRAYKDAIQHNPDHANAYCNMGLSEMIAPGLDQAIRTLGKAVTIDPAHDMARFYQAVATEMTGADAARLFDDLPGDDDAVAAWCDSWDYVKSHSTLSTEIIHCPYALLSHALDKATLDGLALEFGVRHGQSIRHIAAETDQPVHGFDSFEGLPAAWGHEPEGVYSTGGRLPDVPDNVTLHAGLFADTLEPFLEKHPVQIRFCNIDCDIYASTVTVLDGIAPRVRPGTVLVFDEYLINPTWRDDEHKAFREAVEKYGWTYSYLAFGIVTKQAAVVIDGI